MLLINLPYVVSAESALKELKKEAELIAMGKDLPVRLGVFSSISNSWLPDGVCVRPLNPPASRMIVAALPKEPLRAAVDFVKYLITQETGRN